MPRHDANKMSIKFIITSVMVASASKAAYYLEKVFDRQGKGAAMVAALLS